MSEQKKNTVIISASQDAAAGCAIGFHHAVDGSESPYDAWSVARACAAVWAALDFDRPGAQSAVMAELDGLAQTLGAHASRADDADGVLKTYPPAVLKAFLNKLRDPGFLAEFRTARRPSRTFDFLAGLFTLLLAMLLVAPFTLVGRCVWSLCRIPVDFLRGVSDLYAELKAR